MTRIANRTEAETAIADQFARVAASLPGGGWVPAARAAAMRAFAGAGLPHRRIEAWKYTDLRNDLRTAFPPASCAKRLLDETGLATALGAPLAGLAAMRVVLVNGRLAMSAKQPVAGCHIGSLGGVLGLPGHDWVEAAFAASHDEGDDPIKALNAAFVTDGVVLRVSKDTRLALPIHIVSITDTDTPAAIATRNLIEIEAGAEATIVESHIEIGSGPSQATAVTRISVAAGAKVNHIKYAATPAGSAHLCRWDVEIGRDGGYRGFQLTAGAGLLRNETRIRFAGPDASLDLSGLMLGRGSDHIDTTMVIDHTTTGCESRELFKAVLDDRASAVFQAKVIVAPEAQKTDGKQMAQALMLSDDAEFDAKPELEIYADDVVCGHGATATELDAEMLFYLRSRGIPLAEARSLLIESFAAETFEKIESEDLRNALAAMSLDWLRRD